MANQNFSHTVMVRTHVVRQTAVRKLHSATSGLRATISSSSSSCPLALKAMSLSGLVGVTLLSMPTKGNGVENRVLCAPAEEKEHKTEGVKVLVALEPPSLGKRVVCFIVDGLFSRAVAIAFHILSGVLFNSERSTFAEIIALAYILVKDALPGGSIGQRVTGITAVKTSKTGDNLSLEGDAARSVTRNITHPVALLGYWVIWKHSGMSSEPTDGEQTASLLLLLGGLVFSLFDGAQTTLDEYQRGLGDKLAHTRVVVLQQPVVSTSTPATSS
eukprot:GILK01006760.1.p1 GENE.GILK01006760.1~~GILK01006760.1.p1  ORF type:complete len:303 (+),score=32.75 GILK01006760.1:92-910(+)